MIFRALAYMTGTPRWEAGLRAYDVTFKTADSPLEQQDTILTQGNEGVGDQIRTSVYDQHPDTTDYTFKELDYFNFQMRCAARIVIDLSMHKQRSVTGPTEIMEY